MRRVALVLVAAALPAIAGSDPWKPAPGLTSGSVTVVRSNDADPRVLWAGGSGGVYRSADGGRTWTLKSAAIPDPQGLGVVQRGLDVFRRNPNVVVTGVGGAVHRSDDGGATWTGDSASASRILMLAFDPDASNLYYGVSDVYDGTCWWSSVGASNCRQDQQIGTAFAIDPGHPDVLYGGSLLRSLNRGVAWERLSPPFTVGFLRADQMGGLWAGSAPHVRARVAFSADGGATWSERSYGLPASPFGNVGIVDLTLDAKDPNALVAAVGPGYLFEAGSDENSVRGFYRSVDAGRHWYRVGDHHEALAVAFGGVEAEVLVGGVVGGGVLTSDARPSATPIAIGSVFPDSGSIDGGTLLMIYGDGFTPWTWVTVGGSEATDFTYFDARTIRVRTPPGSGVADVTVHSATGSAQALPGAFRSVDWAAIPVGAGDGAAALENGRFLVSVSWGDAPMAAAHPVVLSQKSAYFWFDFAPAMEVAVKILDGRTIDGHYWFHWSALTEKAVVIRVLDRANPLNQRIYAKPAGALAAGIDKTSF